jgi:PEP-CTERM motif
MNTYSIVNRGLLARSSMRLFACCLGALALASVVSSTSRADIVYDESIWGDFSNSGLAPTAVTFHPGSNQFWGTTGRDGTTRLVDLDYFTITVPTGYALTSFKELPGTISGGNLSFIGLQWGPQVTVLPTTATAAGLLGWAHYSTGLAGTDLFPILQTPTAGSSGFSTLGEGSYSFWIQELSVGSFTYGFEAAISAVPEPSTYGMVGGALVLLLAARRRFFKSAKAA